MLWRRLWSHLGNCYNFICKNHNFCFVAAFLSQSQSFSDADFHKMSVSSYFCPRYTCGLFFHGKEIIWILWGPHSPQQGQNPFRKLCRRFHCSIPLEIPFPGRSISLRQLWGSYPPSLGCAANSYAMCYSYYRDNFSRCFLGPSK